MRKLLTICLIQLAVLATPVVVQATPAQNLQDLLSRQKDYSPVEPAACQGYGRWCPPGYVRACGPYRCWCRPCR